MVGDRTGSGELDLGGRLHLPILRGGLLRGDLGAQDGARGPFEGRGDGVGRLLRRCGDQGGGKEECVHVG